MVCTDRSGQYRDLLVRYAEKAMDPLTRGQMKSHLQECQYCRSQLDELRDFLQFIKFVDKDAFGEKSPCPPAEELVRLSESPRSFTPERLAEIKKHLRECIECADILQRLIALNNWTKQPDFDRQYAIPARMERRLKRAVREHVANGAGGPVNIDLEDGIAEIAPERIEKIAARDAPQGQDRVPVVANEIAGKLSNRDGGAVRNRKVLLMRNGKQACSLRTNSFGEFRFKNLDQGFYELRSGATAKLVILKKGGRKP